MKRALWIGLAVIIIVAVMAQGQPLNPTPAPTPTPTCPNAPPTRLILHERARVATADPRPVNVRSSPGTNQPRIAQLPANEVFFVLEGPVCSERYAWYRIDHDGVMGWIAEGDTTSYYVEVYPPGL
jgi:hypothetical protein